MSDDTLLRVGGDLREWMTRHRIREAADEKAKEYFNPAWSRNGVPFSELKLLFSFSRLLFELKDYEELEPAVTLTYSIAYKKPRFRDRSKIGTFEATFLSNGFLSSAKFEIDDDLLRELRKPPKP